MLDPDAMLSRMTDPSPELSNNDHDYISRELARRKRLLVRSGIGIAALLLSLLAMGLPPWIVAGLLLGHGLWWAYLARHYQRTVEAVRSHGWRGPNPR